jgi:hypothetical protein
MLTREDIENLNLGLADMLRVARNSELDEPIKSQFCCELRFRLAIRETVRDGLLLEENEQLRPYVDELGAQLAWHILYRERRNRRVATALTGYTPPEEP